jgi:hypothetical protein
MRAALVALAAMALTACGPRPPMEEDAQFTLTHIGQDIYVLYDWRTQCEYIYSRRGGFINRADPHGRVTPNCPETGGKYGTVLPEDVDYSKPGWGGPPPPPKTK